MATRPDDTPGATPPETPVLPGEPGPGPDEAPFPGPDIDVPDGDAPEGLPFEEPAEMPPSGALG